LKIPLRVAGEIFMNWAKTCWVMCWLSIMRLILSFIFSKIMSFF
jgi:hypothetical protein